MDAWNEEDLRAWASGSEAGCKNIEGGADGAPDGIRTHDPSFGGQYGTGILFDLKALKVAVSHIL